MAQVVAPGLQKDAEKTAPQQRNSMAREVHRSTFQTPRGIRPLPNVAPESAIENSGFGPKSSVAS